MYPFPNTFSVRSPHSPVVSTHTRRLIAPGFSSSLQPLRPCPALPFTLDPVYRLLVSQSHRPGQTETSKRGCVSKESLDRLRAHAKYPAQSRRSVDDGTTEENASRCNRTKRATTEGTKCPKVRLPPQRRSARVTPTGAALSSPPLAV